MVVFSSACLRPPCARVEHLNQIATSILAVLECFEASLLGTKPMGSGCTFFTPLDGKYPFPLDA